MPSKEVAKRVLHNPVVIKEHSAQARSPQKHYCTLVVNQEGGEATTTQSTISVLSYQAALHMQAFFSCSLHGEVVAFGNTCALSPQANLLDIGICQAQKRSGVLLVCLLVMLDSL
jgi:hypothetical protein